MTINVLIVEDELHTAALLREMIEQDPDCMVTATLESVADAVSYIQKHQQKLDLLFFDIQLADGHSFEIFRHVDIRIPVIFCTAYDEYVLQAIRSNGIDYILKPFKDSEIQRALEKYRRLAHNFSEKAMPLSFEPPVVKNYQHSFLTQYREKTLVKKVSDIAAFFIENETVYLYSFESEKLPLFKNLEYIESVCDPHQFFRINRQLLINRDAVVSIEPYFNRKAIVQLTVKLPEKAIVSKLKVGPFKEWLEH